MDLEELNDFFDDDDAEILDYVQNLRTYSVKERKDYFQESTDEEFFHRFRFTKHAVATNILPPIQNFLINNRAQYHEIDPRTQLLLALRFYATGNFYITVGDFIGIHKTTAGRIIKRITEALVTLRPQYIKFPENEEEKRAVFIDFHQIAQFHRVLGAVDCTHVRIQSPGQDNAEFYRNRKGYFSLNVQVVSDSKHFIRDIVARWPGSAHDSHIFQNSSLRQRFEAGEFGEAILLGDSGYPLKNYLMTPLREPRTRGEQRYNAAHISTRTVVERTFGIWKRKFPILSVGIRCSVTLTQQIIVAVAVLHNISRQIGEPQNFEEPQNIENFEIEPPIENLNNINIVQQQYIHYFSALP